jgi:hypothetical protein
VDYKSNEDIEIRVDLERPEAMIEYRLTTRDPEDDTWHPTPYQRADVTTEDDALALVDGWLEDA